MMPPAAAASESRSNVRVTLKPAPAFIAFARAGAAPPHAAIPDSPSIAVPVSLNSAGLTQVVEHLLREIGVATKPVALLFREVERDAILASTLERFLAKHGLTEEHALVLEYFPKPNEPRPSESCRVPDWISCIKVASDGYVYASSYDGSLFKFQADCALVNKHANAHSAPIRAISLLATADGAASYVLSASKDGTLAAWRSDEMKRVAWGDNLGSPVEAIDAALSSDDVDEALVVVGGMDGILRLFQLKLNELGVTDEGEREVAKSSSKRQQRDAAVQSNVGELAGHADKISAVLWTKLSDPTLCFSASWDSTIRVWDVVRQVETVSWRLPKAATCMAYNSATNLMVSGHADHLLRVWDARIGGGDSACRLTLTSHHGWVSSVALAADGYTVASASYDRTVKVWDLRRPTSLHTMESSQAGRMFAVEWGHADIYAGGSDAELRRYRL